MTLYINVQQFLSNFPPLLVLLRRYNMDISLNVKKRIIYGKRSFYAKRQVAKNLSIPTPEPIILQVAGETNIISKLIVK